MRSDKEPIKIKVTDIIPKDVFYNAFTAGYLLFFPAFIILLSNKFTNITGIISENILFLSLFIIIGAIGPAVCRKSLMIIMGTLFFLWNIADLFCLIQLQTQLQANFLYLLKTTNANECSGFLKIYLFNISNLLLLIYASGAAGVIFCPARFKKVLVAVLTFLLPFLCVLLFKISPSNELCGKNFHDRIDEFLDETCNQNLSAEQLELANSNLDVHTEEEEMTIILVIGESHSKRHSEIYGYPRETNPLLKKLVKNEELFVFLDVVAPHSFTIYSLPKLLTLAAHDREESFIETPNIFDLARSANFKTFWLCNHPAISDRNTPYSVVTRRADEVFHSSPGLQQNPDEAIFPYYEKILQDPAKLKLIVIQLIGSHHDYENTYPKKAEYFLVDEKPAFFNEQQKKHAGLINSYDNSIRYNDFVLYYLIEKFRQDGTKGFLLYLPDHGENLYEQESMILHMEFMPTLQSVEIPMYLYLSPDHPAKDNIAASLSRPFASEDLPYLLLDLGNIHYRNADMTKSPLSPFFRPKKRIVSRCLVDYEKLKHTGAGNLNNQDLR